MKKIVYIVLVMFLLTACGSKTNDIKTDQEISKKLDEKNKLVNVEEQVTKIKNKLKESGLTGEKLEKIVKKQEKGYKMIANLKGDARKEYVFENDILPKLVKNEDITPSYCKTNNTNLYFKCLVKKNVDINKIKESLPEVMQEYVEKKYYYQKYLNNKKDLLKKTTNPIAIEQKKKVIQQLHSLGVLKKSSCSKIPEKDIKIYCVNLFTY